jgi:hypothetical protein
LPAPSQPPQLLLLLLLTLTLQLVHNAPFAARARLALSFCHIPEAAAAATAGLWVDGWDSTA